MKLLWDHVIRFDISLYVDPLDVLLLLNKLNLAQFWKLLNLRKSCLLHKRASCIVRNEVVVMVLCGAEIGTQWDRTCENVTGNVQVSRSSLLGNDSEMESQMEKYHMNMGVFAKVHYEVGCVWIDTILMGVILEVGTLADQELTRFKKIPTADLSSICRPNRVSFEFKEAANRPVEVMNILIVMSFITKWRENIHALNVNFDETKVKEGEKVVLITSFMGDGPEYEENGIAMNDNISNSKHPTHVVTHTKSVSTSLGGQEEVEGELAPTSTNVRTEASEFGCIQNDRDRVKRKAPMHLWPKWKSKLVCSNNTVAMVTNLNKNGSNCYLFGPAICCYC